MGLNQITTHTADALARQRQMYKTAARFNAYIAALSDQMQDVENALWSSISARFLDDSAGSTLDALGLRFGVMRNGLSDDIYRSLIRGTIAALNSQSRIEDVLSAAIGLFGASAVFERTPNASADPASAPAAVLSVGVGSATMPASGLPLAVNMLMKAIGAGIVLDHVFRFDASGAFCMAGNAPWVRGFNHGGFGASIYSNLTA